MIKVPEHITSIKPYVPGKPVEELERELGISGSVKLASNENPLGPSPLAIKAMRSGIKKLNRYPDGSCYYLRNVLSNKLKVRTDQLIFGNGSNEIIELAVRTFISPGDEAIMAHPSFVVYSMIAQAAQGKNIIVPLKDWRHDLDAMASKISDRTRLIFIANPNNPTGTINTKPEMDRFMKKVPDNVLVIVDEAYYEYVESIKYADSFQYLKANRNILVLRTFSKIYGLAGLRIGYGIAKASLIEEMNKVRQPFNVNSLAQAAAIEALKDENHLSRVNQLNIRGKKFLYKELKKMNVSFVPSEANFIYITFTVEVAGKIYDKMLKQGVIVRPMGPKAIRITTGLQRENVKLVKALGKAIK
jgi:histidinol-phosphate aminotransferase